MVLLILGFFFFYWASRVDWHYVTVYNDEANLAYPSRSSEYPPEFPQFGAYEYYAREVDMQPNDVLTVSYPENIQINGTLKILVVLFSEPPLVNPVLASSGYPYREGFVYYRNNMATNGFVGVYLIAQNVQNVTLSSTTTLSHYGTPQWVYFGIGVVLSSLAVIPIFKSKK